MAVLTRTWRACVIILLYLTVATLVFALFARDPEVNTDERATFEKMLAGTADRPFANRILVPLLVNGMDKIIPDSAWQTFVHYRWEPSVRYELNRAHLDSAFAKQWYLFGWLSIACFTGFAACMYALFQRFYSFGLLESHLWALLSLAFLPIFFGPISQLYDPTTLLLFPLAYLCMLEGRLSVYYLVLVLALVNKEISFLLIALFAVVHWHRMRRLTLFGHLAVQCASYVVIRMAIHFYTVHNPGADVENWVSYNLTFIVTPSVLLMLFMLKVVVLTYLVVHQWSKKDVLLRRSFLVVFVPILLLGFYGGRLVSEIRIFYEALFLIYLLAVPTLRKLLSSSLNQIKEPQGGAI